MMFRRCASSLTRRICGRRICGSALELVGRPSLMVPPCCNAEETKVKFKFYSPLNKEDTVREVDVDLLPKHPRWVGRKVVDLVRGKRGRWVGSSHGWLVLFGVGGIHEMCLFNPLSGSRIKLPPLSGEPFFEGDDHPHPLKVILTHSPGKEDCRAVMILGERDRAAFCSPGKCKSWSPLGRWYGFPPYFFKRPYNDFVYSSSRNALLSVARVNSGSLISGGRVSEELEFWDASSSMKKPVKKVSTSCYSMSSDPRDIYLTYLVSEEESGQLFMVRRYVTDNERRVDYKVYRIITNTSDDVKGEDDDVQLQLCESLDGLVMFIGVNHGFAVKASKYPEYKPDCIYFSGFWYDCDKFVDMYSYNDKAYSQLIDLSPNEFPYHSPLPWFTLTN